MTITQIAGIWLPASETHLTAYLNQTAKKTGGRGSYQLGTLATFLKHVPFERRRNVLDIGGHVGLWSMHLSKYFEQVYAFEPTPVLQECFEHNVLTHPAEARDNVRLFKTALSNTSGKTVRISFERDNSGHTHVAPTDPSKHIEGADHIEVTTTILDQYSLGNVDAIKIDVEGFEYAVLQGGERMIRANKPIICIEQKPHGFYEWGQYDAIKLLMSWGAKPVERVVDDFILTWE
jgi:FkbM family methyltransferase